MRAVRIVAHGGVERLEVHDVPRPEPGPGEVRVRVTHVGLNHLDVWVRRGVEGHPFPLPITPGSDIVGVREDTGDVVAVHPATWCGACRRCLEGRQDLCRSYRIRGESQDGGCAEEIVVRPEHLLRCTLPPEQAAALPLALLTAWHMVVGRAQVAPGEAVVVQGGAGGVGSLVIQVARLCGARVAATASTEAKRLLCAELGADAVFGYDDAIAGVKRWTGGDGAAVVFDCNGSPTWAASLRMLGWGGRIAVCGATGGPKVELDLRALFFKQLSFLGSTMGSPAELLAAWDAVAAGRIRPVVDTVLPMSQIAEAHRRIESRAVAGKIVLRQDLGNFVAN